MQASAPQQGKKVKLKKIIMAICETCGNDDDKTFEVTINGETHVFDSFECAAHMLAPTCAHCANA
jgi:hypothetical protein